MSANDPQPRYGQNPETYGDAGQPDAAAAQYGQQAPQYGQEVPAAPQYGQQAPQYGQQAPQFGQPPAAPQYGQGYGEQPGFGQSPFGAPTTEKNSLGTTALVLGIIGVLAFWIPIVALGLGIAATVVGAKAKNAVKQGIATNGGAARAGFILGIVAIVVGVLFWIISIALAFSEFGMGI